MKVFDSSLLYRHKRNNTIAFRMTSQHLVDDIWHLNVVWWNIGVCHKPFCMFLFQDIKIPSSKISEWVVMQTDEVLSESASKEAYEDLLWVQS